MIQTTGSAVVSDVLIICFPQFEKVDDKVGRCPKEEAFYQHRVAHQRNAMKGKLMTNDVVAGAKSNLTSAAKRLAKI